MPIYHHFHFECCGPDGWFVPADFVSEKNGFSGEPFRSFGQFAFAHPIAGWLELFYGDGALFPLRPGTPDDRRGSPLLRYFDRYGDDFPDDIRPCWIPYADLMIDSWEVDELLVGAKVPAKYALLFGDGRQAFPSEALSRAGFDLDRFDNCDVRLQDEAIDRASGHGRFVLADKPPTYDVEVTWLTTIANYIGWSGEFKRLRTFARDEDLRILVTRG